MALTISKIFCILFITLLPLMATAQDRESVHNLLDIETPNFFQYNSPLKEPESLRSQPYFDFLSTLYRRDATKSDLFRPYVRNSRAAVPEVPVVSAESVNVKQPAHERSRRAIVFRPLFVYREQQIKKQQLAAKRKRRY